MIVQTVLILGLTSLVNAFFTIDVNNPNPALDQELYENVLDAEECKKQIETVQRNTLLSLQFADAGLRIPRGITEGNFVDLGNYRQCLNIRHEADDTQIQGKYCLIQVPTTQNLTVPWDMKWSGFDPTSLVVDEETKTEVKKLNSWRAESLRSLGIWDDSFTKALPGVASSVEFSLAMCIPKPCTTQEALSYFFFNVTAIGFEYTDQFCRLPDDKPWSPADTVATVVFAIIGLLTLLSTSYDLLNKFWFKNDPKQSKPLYTSFSVYTNGRRLMTFSTSSSGTMHCIDGIRTLAMAWVVIGHTFATEPMLANPIALVWMFSSESLWITSAPITVDTFFCLSGIVLVYSTAGKMSGAQLLKNLPLFYLNRILRLLPILAIAVLLQASYFNRILDGPIWTTVANQTNYCRTNWWLTLLNVQNYINPLEMCIPHSWYIAIDLHCYIVSPLVLYWVLGRSRKVAWIALATALIVVLTGAGVYNFTQNFPSGLIQPGHQSARQDYTVYFYLNTLTRMSPFFVGMICGYVLHLLREKKLQLSWISVVTLWLCAASVSTLIFYYPAFTMDFEWDNQFVDNVMNSIMRPAWGAAICWLIVACVHGYGGPVNWFLSLDIWKLPARISYAIFIFHYPMMFVINSSALAPIYFTVPKFTFKFLAHMSLVLVVAFFITLLIDSPCSTICKQLMEGKKKKPILTGKPDTNDKIPEVEGLEAIGHNGMPHK